MIYQPPCVTYEGNLDQMLKRLIPFRASQTSSGDSTIDKILVLVEKTTGLADCHLHDLCRQLQLGLSPRAVGTLFKRVTGMKFRDYLVHRRMEIAAKQLTDTDLPIKVIAAEVGCIPQHFTRRFKTHFQLSPTAYRKRRALYDPNAMADRSDGSKR